MEQYIRSMHNRIELLRKAIKIAERDKDAAVFPEGRLRISNAGGHQRYFYVNNEENSGECYISKKNTELVKTLAQKEYNKDFLKTARAELQKLQKSVASLTKLDAASVYENANDSRKKFIKPYILPNDLYAKEWLEKPFKSNTYLPENKKYDTRKGDKVRSKSEAIIADTLFELGIPYRYECALVLKGNVVKYPDFTMLKISTREEHYLEHFGLLDDEEYREQFFEKLEEYRKNGIYPGKNLLFTYETETHPLDITGIRKMLKELML